MGNYPLVTVFTLIYNTNPRYIIEAIESVRANNYPNIQHIIIDDCSPDPNPKAIVKDWILNERYPCEFYEHDTNFGICKTLNHVLELAKGEYLIGCCDDLITKTRIWDDVRILGDLDENYVLVFGLAQIIDKDSNLSMRVFGTIDKVPSDSNYFELLTDGNCIATQSVTIRLKMLKEIGGFDENYLFEDYPLWLKFSAIGLKFAVNPTVNGYYRVHAESISNELNYVTLCFEVLCQYLEVPMVHEKIRSRIISMGINKDSNYTRCMEIYSTKNKPDWIMVMAGIKQSLLKKVIFIFVNGILKSK
jgi:glycosyltransferase involved in cell wall biosynthesis